jgi:hypothetical protein
MKSLLKILLILAVSLCLCGPAWPFDDDEILQPVASGSPSYLLNESFTGTGTPTGWSTSGTVTFNDNATLSSDYAMLISPSFTEQSTAYIKFEYTSSAVAYDSIAIFFYLRNSTTTIAEIRIQSNWLPIIYHGTTTQYGSTGDEFTAATTHYVWIDYVASSGSDDGTFDLYINTSDSKPGVATLSLTGGTSTDGVDNIRFSRRFQDNIFDNAKVSGDEF